MSSFTITDHFQWKAFNLRMSDELKAKLQREAAQNHRSLNSEIVSRLEQSLTGYRR